MAGRQMTPSSPLSLIRWPGPNIHKLSLFSNSLFTAGWMGAERKRMETFWLHDIKLTLTGTVQMARDKLCDWLSLAGSWSQYHTEWEKTSQSSFLILLMFVQLFSHQDDVISWTMMSSGSGFCQFCTRQDGKWYWRQKSV